MLAKTFDLHEGLDSQLGVRTNELIRTQLETICKATGLRYAEIMREAIGSYHKKVVTNTRRKSKRKNSRR